MATILNKEQLERRGAAESAVNSVRKDKPEPRGGSGSRLNICLRSTSSTPVWSNTIAVNEIFNIVTHNTSTL